MTHVQILNKSLRRGGPPPRLVGHRTRRSTGQIDQLTISREGTGTPCKTSVCNQSVMPPRNHFCPIPGYSPPRRQVTGSLGTRVPSGVLRSIRRVAPSSSAGFVEKLRHHSPPHRQRQPMPALFAMRPTSRERLPVPFRHFPDVPVMGTFRRPMFGSRTRPGAEFSRWQCSLQCDE